MTFKPNKAFILAAGMGTRMRPLTDHIPKPMVQLAGRPVIDHIIEKLEQAGVTDIMVNTHYLSPVLEKHLKAIQHPAIYTSYEPELLDTAGGIKNVLGFFGDDPFYVIAGDAFWTEGPDMSALDLLASHWDGDRMDILTLMQPLATMAPTEGLGDYTMEPGGRVKRQTNKSGTHMWTNIRLNHPRLYKDCPAGPSSFLPLMDACEKQGRFYAFDHPGAWHHISTPRDLEAVNKMLEPSQNV